MIIEDENMTDAPETIHAIIGYDGHDAHSGKRVVTGEFHTIPDIRHGEEVTYTRMKSEKG